MNRDGFGRIAVALKSKPSQEGASWDEMVELYFIVLQGIDDAYVEPLLRWILIDCKIWRPTTDQLLDWYRARAGVLAPSGRSVVAEIQTAIARHGRYGRPDPQNPRVRMEGMPDGLSVAARRFIEERGGWPALCEHHFTNEEFYWRDAEIDAARILDVVKIEIERLEAHQQRALIGGEK